MVSYYGQYEEAPIPAVAAPAEGLALLEPKPEGHESNGSAGDAADSPVDNGAGGVVTAAAEGSAAPEESSPIPVAASEEQSVTIVNEEQAL